MALPTAPSVDLLSFTFEYECHNDEVPVLIDASDVSRFVTQKTARNTVRKLIAGLRANGLERGDCVCIHAFNDIYYPLLYLAVIGAGGIYTGSNPAYTPLELKHHVKTAHAKFMIGEPSLLTTVLEVATECKIAPSNVFVFDAVDHACYADHLRSWTALLSHGEADWVQFHEPDIGKDSIATLAFTSGTTGLPKAAMIAHAYHVSQIWAVQSRAKPYQVLRLLCLPAFHTFGLPLISGCALREGHPVYLMRRFEVRRFVESISRFAITETAVVPAMILAINTYCTGPVGRHNLDSLRYVWSAGSPLRHSTQSEFQSALSPDAKVVQVWGMTELGWATALFWPEGDETGSVGRALPGMQIKLVSDDGSIITADGIEGEIRVSSPYMMRGYLDDPTASALAVDASGYLCSGDVAYRREGKYYIVDRKKDLLKVRGWQVSPAELEAVLLTHRGVAGAAILGVMGEQDDRGAGEVPRAYVVRKPPSDVQERELQDYIAARLARYKHLAGGVRFVEEIPRNASGKVLRSKLRALDAEHDALVPSVTPVRQTANQNDASRRELGADEATGSGRVSQETSTTVDCDAAHELTTGGRDTGATTPDPNEGRVSLLETLWARTGPKSEPTTHGSHGAPRATLAASAALTAVTTAIGVVVGGLCWSRWGRWR